MTLTRLITLAAVVILIAYGMWRHANLPNEHRPTRIEEMLRDIEADTVNLNRTSDDLAASTAALRRATEEAERIRKEIEAEKP